MDGVRGPELTAEVQAMVIGVNEYALCAPHSCAAFRANRPITPAPNTTTLSPSLTFACATAGYCTPKVRPA